MSLSELIRQGTGYYHATAGALTGTRGKAQATVARAMQLTEVAGGAFAGSFLTTKLGGPNGKSLPLGIPLTIGCGTAMFGAAAFDLGGRYNQDLANVATGFVAAYFAGVGREAGQGRMNFRVGATPNQAGYREFVSLNDRRR